MCCPQEDHATAALDRTKRNGIPVTESGLDVMQGNPIVGCVPVEALESAIICIAFIMLYLTCRLFVLIF